jgi:hypothetical protein
MENFSIANPPNVLQCRAQGSTEAPESMGEAPPVVSASRGSMLSPTNLFPRKRKNLLW